MVRSQKISVDTAGAAGSASGNGYSEVPIAGEILAVDVDWHASAPNTSDLTVTVEADDKHPATTLYAKTNAVSDTRVYPHVQATDTAGAAITGWYTKVAAVGRIKVNVAQCDPLTAAVVVTVYFRE